MNKPDLIEKQNRLAELKENNVSLKSKISGKKSYYSSYQELLKIFKDVYNGQELLFNSDGKIIDFALARYQEISNKFSKMTPLEKRTIECYAKLWYFSNKVLPKRWRLALPRKGVISMSIMETIALLALIADIVFVTYTITKKK